MKYSIHNEIISSAYDGFAENEESRTQKGLAKIESEIIKEKLKQHVPLNARVADIGSGPGVFSLWLAKQGYSVDLLDLSERSLELAKYRSKDLANKEKISFTKGSADDLSVLPCTNYGAIIEFGPIYHAISSEHVKDIMNESFSRLDDNGIFIFCYANSSQIIKELIENENYHLASDMMDEIAINGYATVKSELSDLGTFIATKNYFDEVLSDLGLFIIDQFGTEQVFSDKNIRNEFIFSKIDKKLESSIRKFSNSVIGLNHSRFIFVIVKKILTRN